MISPHKLIYVSDKKTDLRSSSTGVFRGIESTVPDLKRRREYGYGGMWYGVCAMDWRMDEGWRTGDEDDEGLRE